METGMSLSILSASRDPLGHDRSRSPLLPTRVWLALGIVLLFHGGLLLSGTYRGTYDAYVHIFFADHYSRDWFSTWDQRWYTGFSTVSYPPGTHMSVALLSKVTGSLLSGFVITQISALLLLTVGVYRFSRLWVDERAAANASLLLAASSSISQTVHLYGQLPTTFALAFLLNAIPFLERWIRFGRRRDLVVGIITLAACTAGHHVTTLFGSIFFLGPVLVCTLLDLSREPLDDEPEDGHLISVTRRTAIPLMARRTRRIMGPVVRGMVLGPCILVALIGVVLPYWAWSASDPIVQTPIPHGSRANFLADANLGLIFFAIPWGMMFFILPYALMRSATRRLWPLGASIGLAFVLGTGGTTPVPRMLLGKAFDILTLDRFTFWASILILPLAGTFVTSLEEGSIRNWLERTGGRMLSRAAVGLLAIAMISIALFASTLSRHRPFQPDPIDPNPIVAFMEKDQHERWRYLTLGFGDQVAWVSAQMTATQVDGNYHSARRLPELTSTSVERLEGAKYRGISGLGSLQQFLEVPEKYNLKYVFSNDTFYDPLLASLGWRELGPLENAIVVWEKNDIAPLPANLPERQVPTWQRMMWGAVPPTVISMAIVVLIGSLFVRFVAPVGAPAPYRRGPLGLTARLLNRVAIRCDTEGNKAQRPERDRVIAKARRRLARPISMARRSLRLGVLAMIVLAPLALFIQTRSEPPTAEEVLVEYYDHLDFRRWEQAYDMLDPVERPDYELWRLQTSVTGGLLASYAKLATIEVETTLAADGRATIRADVRYLTALDWYDVSRDHQLIERDDSWFVSADEIDLDIPPDQIARRAGVDYIIQGRRQVSSLTTELSDVLDRPEVAVTDARLLEFEGRPVLIGEIVNLDVDPADLTITGILRNDEGEIVGQYNATDRLKRTLNPREQGPFLIEFEEVAAGVDLDFDPTDFQPIQLDEEIVGVELYAKAVVTSTGLFRELQVLDLAIDFESVQEISEPLPDIGEALTEDGELLAEVSEDVPETVGTISGTLRNDGVIEAIVPIVIVSFLDEDGRVMWVERFIVDQSVRPQRSVDFDFALPNLDGVVETDVPLALFHNGVVPADDAPQPPPPMLVVDDQPYASIRVDVVSVLVGE